MSAAAPESNSPPEAFSTPFREDDRLGPYRLLEALGRGGQGIVYLAEHTELKRKVALKVLSDIGPGSEDTVMRFRREAEVASKLDHPGICSIYEAGVHGQVPYIAMSYVEGETVARRIAATRDGASDESFLSIDLCETKLPSSATVEDATTDATEASPSKQQITRILWFFEQTARALHEAHEHGVIHRDIKPQNIMINRRGEPVILDFGLARDVEGDQQTLTRTGDLFGTPAYMSPEQLVAQRIPLDRRTDVYSLGVALYESLTLKKPFEAPSRAALYQAIMADDPSDARRLNPAIPPDLKVVLDASLEKNRDRRYQTALDLAEDLRRVRQFERIKARPIGRLLRIKRWSQRHPATAVGLCGLVLLLTTALVISLAFLGELSRSHTDLERSFNRTRALALVSVSAQAGGSDQMLALLLAIRAVELERMPETVTRLHQAFAESRERAVVVSGAGSLHSVMFSADERHVLTASGQVARIWRIDGSLVATYRHEGAVQSAVFGPGEEDRLILTACSDGKVRLWDRNDQKAPLRTFVDGSPVTSAVFDTNPERGWILTVSEDGKVRIWDETGADKPLRSFDAGKMPVKVVLSPDGKRFMTTHEGHVALWAFDDPQPKHVFRATDLPSLQGFGLAPRACFSPKGDLLVTAWSGGLAHLWSSDGSLLCEIRGNTADVMGVCFSPDGRFILTTSAGQAARLFDRKGNQVAMYRGHRHHAVLSPDFSRDEKRFLTCSRDGTVRMWNVPRFIHHEGFVFSAFFNKTGDRILTAAGDGTARISDLEGQPLVPIDLEHYPSCAAISNDGRLIATVGGEPNNFIRIWDDFGNSRAGPFKGHEDWTEYATFSPDDSLLLTASADGTARLWSVETGRAVDSFVHPGFVGQGTFSPDGQHILTACADGNAYLWRVDTGECVRVFMATDTRPASVVRTAVYSPQGDAILTATGDHVARLWSLEGVLQEELRGHGGSVLGAAFSPDGSLIVTASRDQTARLWTREGQFITTLAGHSGIVREAVFHPDGDRILTCSFDGSARIWWVDTDTLLEKARERITRKFTPDQLEPYADLLENR